MTDAHSNNYDEESCAICFDDKHLIDNFFCDCNFKYHKDCYLEWLNNKENSCIVCGSPISKLYLKGLNTINKYLLDTKQIDKQALLCDVVKSDMSNITDTINIQSNNQVVENQVVEYICWRCNSNFIFYIGAFISVILMIIFIIIVKIN